MKLPYSFHNTLVFRSPLLPFTGELMEKNAIFNISQQPYFKEAIYLASPVLFNELVKWHSGQLTDEREISRLIISISKYFSRMQSRCTPYGLFAACSTGTWDDEDLNIVQQLRRQTRLDMNFVCALAQKVAKDHNILSHLLLYPNSSIYLIGNNLRYVEYKYVHSRRIHQISSIDFNDYVNTVLLAAEKGTTIEALTKLIVSEDVSAEEAYSFIVELLESQILVTEIEPCVTGEELTLQLSTILRRINSKVIEPEIQKIIDVLDSINSNIAILDASAGNKVEEYNKIIDQIKGIGVPFEENQLFQTDLYKATEKSILNLQRQKDILDTIAFCNRLYSAEEKPNLKKFKETFYDCYETAELPLLMVLDTECGIGYTGKDRRGVNALVDDLFIFPIDQEEASAKLTMQNRFLHGKLVKAYKEDKYTVTFTDSDIEPFNFEREAVPDTLAVMFKVLDDQKIYFQNCGGSTAANLLGRFAQGHPNIHELVQDICTHEKELNNNAIVAEIVHLPESRTGNILLRPIIREYEIPYLSKSSLDLEHQIHLKDLMVSIRNNRIYLRSKKHNKEIIPRLSTAHNYSNNALPVYQFLCDLQTQNFDKPYFAFSWGSFASNFKFLPRAEYKNVILSKAKWKLEKPDFIPLLNLSPDRVHPVTLEWQKTWKMPRYICLADGDNELLIDFESLLSVEMFISTIKKRENIVIEEFLFEPGKLIVQDNEGKGYTNEFIAVLFKQAPNSRAKQQIELAPAQSVTRDFCIGSEWLYYKFYCGIKTADKILSEIVKPLTEQLFVQKMITDFFFIRYGDPDLHIRLRLKVAQSGYLGEVISSVFTYVKPYVSNGLISRVITDTYKRELERYGTSTIEFGESLFSVDSIACVNLIDLIDGEEGEIIRWKFYLRAVDDLLSVFEYGKEQKLIFFESMKEQFIIEHGGSKDLRLQLDNKFRTTRKDIEDFLDRSKDEQRDLTPIIDLLRWRHTRITPLAKGILDLQKQGLLETTLNNLLASYIHMTCNRLFKSRQRTHEMVVYDLLYRYYKSALAREKASKKHHQIESIN